MHADESNLDAILQSILETGEEPEVACARCPQLLEEVKTRLARVRALESHLSELLPAPSGSSRAAADEERTLTAKLPKIPGYEVESVLGFGGMGAVYRGRHLALNRPVAIKTLLAGSFASPKDLERFKREAESIAALCHPNILQVFDAGECDGAPYFVMEYMAGGTLAHKLAGRPMPARAAAECVQLLARAVHAAHRAGIVHRDLKPSNILIGADGTMKIADFGLAGRADPIGAGRAALTGASMGTPSYMAPEQAAGGATAFCPLVDVYALGAMLYEMLTGRPPFRDDSAAETIRQVLFAEPVPPSRLNASTPRDIDVICMKCLEKNAARRYDSATALADDLERALRGEPIHARPIGPARRVVRWARRRRAQAALVAVGLLVLSASLGGAAWIGARREAMRAALSAELEDVEATERSGDYAGAGLALSLARSHLTPSASDELLARFDAVQNNLELVDRLGAIRMERAGTWHLRFDREHFWNRYHEEFSRAGLLGSGDSAPEFGARVRESPVRSALVDAMDDWATCASDKDKLAWLLDSTRAAAPDPVWRDRARDHRLWSDPAQLARIAAEADVVNQSVPLLLMLAGLLHDGTDGAVGFLREVQRAHASDFWTNFTLAEALEVRGDSDAVVFYQVALALRPRAIAPCINLGNVLKSLGRRDEGRVYWERALTLDRNSVAARENLAIDLLELGRLDESLEHCRAGIAIDPNSITCYSVAGSVHFHRGEFALGAGFLRTGLANDDGTSPDRAEMMSALDRCERFIAMEARLSHVLEDAASLESHEETIAFASMCMQTRRYVSASRLFARALSPPTHLAVDARVQDSYNAACAAALAASGAGPEAGALADGERAEFRGRARDLLLSNIALVRRSLPDADGGTRAQIAREVRAWRTDPDLRAVRDDEFVNTMADDERAACAHVWTTYESMLSGLSAPEGARQQQTQ